jgi:hypothetical protein
MYSINRGVNWSDAGLEGVISARAVSWGSNPNTGSNTVVIACEATTSSNTIITYKYKNISSFIPYVGNTLTSSIISVIYSSNSGSNFVSSSTYGFDIAGYSITYNQTSKWYAGGSGTKTILQSTNGSNWVNGPSNPIDIAVYGILATGTINIYAVGKSSVPGNTVCYGTSFDNILRPISGGFDNVGYGIATYGSMLIAVGSGQNSGTILYTTNTTNLSNNTTGAFSIAGYGVAYGNGRWVAVGKSSSTSNILYSTNGSNWSNGNYGFDIQGQGVIYRNILQSTLWVAVGKGVQTSNILYSSDGLNWFNANTTTFSNIGYSVTWDGVKNFVAVGDSGTLTSPDGSNWYTIASGDFKNQSTIVGSGKIILSGSTGYGVASDGYGKIVAVGAASNTNRQYNWSKINSQDLALGTPPFTGFSSVLSEDGITIQPTYLATTAVYDPLKGQFIVGGLTNNTCNCIVNNSTSGSIDLNIWTQSETTSFNATNELQFINSCNRTIVAKDITTNLVYASNAYISQSLFISTNTNTYTLNATNINSLNINTDNLTSKIVSTNNLNVGNLKSINISTTLISSSHILTSTIAVNTLTFSNSIGNYATINTLSSIYTTASFFYGDGRNLRNIVASTLSDLGPGPGYSINNTDVHLSTLYADTINVVKINISGPALEPSSSPGSITANTLTINNNTSLSGGTNIYGGLNVQTGIISGNGSGLTNISATQLSSNVNQNIGTGTIRAGAFYGNGIGLSNIQTAVAATTATYATTAGSASNATYAENANHAITAQVGLDGFRCGTPITAMGGFIAVDSAYKTLCSISGNGIVCSGNIQGATITATGGFIGDGSRLTGINSGGGGGGGGGGPYKVSQGNVRYNAGVQTFSACFIPKGLQVYSILKIIVATRPNTGAGSYHIAEVMLKGGEQQSLTFLSDIIFGSDFSGDTRSAGDNALTPPPTKGIYFEFDGTNYTLIYKGYAPTYTYGMYGVIQQQV